MYPGTHISVRVASYEEISNQFPSDRKIRLMEGRPDLTPDDCDAIRATKYLGPLYEMVFYRIILDEAHAIKNYYSQRKAQY
jgi:SNF2 family DNA or RNA helicase